MRVEMEEFSFLISMRTLESSSSGLVQSPDVVVGMHVCISWWFGLSHFSPTYRLVHTPYLLESEILQLRG